MSDPKEAGKPSPAVVLAVVKNESEVKTEAKVSASGETVKPSSPEAAPKPAPAANTTTPWGETPAGETKAKSPETPAAVNVTVKPKAPPKAATVSASAMPAAKMEASNGANGGSEPSKPQETKPVSEEPAAQKPLFEETPASAPQIAETPKAPEPKAKPVEEAPAPMSAAKEEPAPEEPQARETKTDETLFFQAAFTSPVPGVFLPMKAMESAMRIGMRMAEFTRDNAQANMEAAQKLMTSGNLGEALDYQRSFTQERMRVCAEQVRELGKLALEGTQEAWQETKKETDRPSD